VPVPHLCKGTILKEQESVKRMGIQRRLRELDERVEVQLSVGDSHGKLVVEEEL
jgi:hypothetical protein